MQMKSLPKNMLTVFQLLLKLKNELILAVIGYLNHLEHKNYNKKDTVKIFVLIYFCVNSFISFWRKDNLVDGKGLNQIVILILKLIVF